MGVMDRIGTSEFKRVRSVIVNQSPFSGKVYRSGLDDWRWTFTFTYQLQTRMQAAPLLALIAAQGEGLGSFIVFDPDFGKPMSGNNAIGTVSGAGQTGTSLVTAGWGAGALVARAGDRVWVEFNTGTTGAPYRMYVVLADATANGAGQATLLLDAPLRASPANGAQVSLNFFDYGAGVLVRMTGYTATSEPGSRFAITLSGEEIV